VLLASLLLQLSLSSQPPQPYIGLPDHLFPNKNNKRSNTISQKDFLQTTNKVSIKVTTLPLAFSL
jgi:hypothetical protein